MFKVMLDPGHGGTEPGAVNSKFKEKDINLIVAKAALSYLEKYEELDVKMIRYTDTTIPHYERPDISNLWGADLFLSIHHNAGGGEGYEVYHYPGSIRGEHFATLLSQELDSLDLIGRYVGSGMMCDPNKGNYTVVEQTDCPACLVEACFMDTKDFENFDELEELYEQGEAYGRAILRYFDIKVKDVKPVEEPHNCLEMRVSKLESRVKELEKIIISGGGN